MAEFTQSDYLDITPDSARAQWRGLFERSPVPAGRRQVAFQPVETLMCAFAALVVNHRSYGGSTAHRAASPVPELARLGKRPATSILRKMGNLDGTHVNGGRLDLLVGTLLHADPDLAADVYRRVLAGARAAGIDAHQLPDFLGLEAGGSIALLGQDELRRSEVEEVLHREAQHLAATRQDLTPADTERLTTVAARIGQHRFASGVLQNCGHQCVFCGLSVDGGHADRLLIASHIKPWRDSTPHERIDVRNGLAACPTHDVAFDTGLLTVARDGGIEVGAALRRDLARGLESTRSAFGQPPMRRRIDLARPDAAEPRAKYLDWHRERIFAA